jgi:hypothetical protein
VAACLGGCVSSSREQELRTRVPGTWSATAPDGTALTMVLNGDGTGNVNGHAGTWEIRVGRILMSDGEHLIPCDLEADQLRCHTPEGDLIFSRGAAVIAEAAPSGPAAEEPPARLFTPEKTVPGQSFTAGEPIPGAFFTVPEGWTHAAEEGGYVLRSGERNAITIVRYSGAVPETIDRQLVKSAIESHLSAQHEMVLEPEPIEVAGQSAARVIVRADGSEHYAALIRRPEGGAYFIIGRYPVEEADAVRPVVDTVLASFRAAP